MDSPLKDDHRSPVDDVIQGSKAWVTALRLALAVTSGAPEAGYGPISAGLSSHNPGLTSGSLKVTLALSPSIEPVVPVWSFNPGEISGSPGKYSRSKVTGAVPVMVAWSCTRLGRHEVVRVAEPRRQRQRHVGRRCREVLVQQVDGLGLVPTAGRRRTPRARSPVLMTLTYVRLRGAGGNRWIVVRQVVDDVDVVELNRAGERLFEFQSGDGIEPFDDEAPLPRHGVRLVQGRPRGSPWAPRRR